MSLAEGGHLTHGAKVNFSGKPTTPCSTASIAETGLIDYDQVQALADRAQAEDDRCRFLGLLAIVDWQRFRDIADECRRLPDGRHGARRRPRRRRVTTRARYRLPTWCTSTTHKTLRGPRGGIILAAQERGDDEEVQLAGVPGHAGRPARCTCIAAKAVAFKEAMEPEFVATTRSR